MRVKALSNAWDNMDAAVGVARDTRLMLTSVRDLLAALEKPQPGAVVPLSFEGATGLVLMLDFLTGQLQHLEDDLGEAQKELVQKAG